MKQTTPKVYIVGQTTASPMGLKAMLAELGAPNWRTDAVSDAELLTEVAGKLCYKSFSLDMNNNLTRVGTRTNHDYIQQGLIETRHGSVLEHTTVNVVLLDVSRVLTHELVRHGEGTAFSQESGRYVRGTEVSMFIPTCIQENPDLLYEFIQTVKLIEAQYTKLVTLSGVNDATDFTFKKTMTSALRRILPEGRANSIFLTANHRAFRHIIEMRTSHHAEEEIRIAFYQVFVELSKRFPAIYSDAQVTEVAGHPEVVFRHSKV